MLCCAKKAAEDVAPSSQSGSKVEITENPINLARKQKEEEEAAAAAAAEAASTAAAEAATASASDAEAPAALRHSQIETRKRVTEIYKYYSPKSLNELPVLFEKFNGNEEAILLDLEKKYPATRRASAKVDMSALYGDGEVVRDSENSMIPKEGQKSIIPFSGLSTTTITVPDPRIWLYLDDGIELGPFATAEMLDRFKSGTCKEEMRLKQSHWTDYYDLRKIYTSLGEEFTFTPPEPRNGSVSQERAAVKAYSPAPRPMRKGGSVIPVANGSMLPPSSA